MFAAVSSHEAVVGSLFASRIRSAGSGMRACLATSLFQREQGFLGLQASGKSCEGAGGANDAMTRRDDGDGVLAIRRSDRPRGPGAPQLTSDLAVRPCFPERDAKKRTPHPVLKLGADEVELHIERVAPA